MAVIANLDLFVPHGDHSFNIELVLAQILNAGGGEDNDLAALRCAEIVAYPIDEEVVAGADAQFDNIFTGVKELAAVQTGALLEGLLPIVRRKPDGISFASD